MGNREERCLILVATLQSGAAVGIILHPTNFPFVNFTWKETSRKEAIPRWCECFIESKWVWAVQRMDWMDNVVSCSDTCFGTKAFISPAVGITCWWLRANPPPRIARRWKEFLRPTLCPLPRCSPHPTTGHCGAIQIRPPYLNLEQPRKASVASKLLWDLLRFFFFCNYVTIRLSFYSILVPLCLTIFILRPLQNKLPIHKSVSLSFSWEIWHKRVSY